MIQKGTKLNVIDSCGVVIVKTFHIYKGFKHRIGGVGDFIKCSVRQVKSIKKRKMKNPLVKGKKSIGIIIRTKFKSLRKDGSYVKTFSNDVVLLKKRMTPRGKELTGPITYGVKRRKFVASFIGVV